MSDLTDCSWGRRISDEEEDDEWNISRVDGVEVVVPLGVLGGRVTRRR